MTSWVPASQACDKRRRNWGADGRSQLPAGGVGELGTRLPVRDGDDAAREDETPRLEA